MSKTARTLRPWLRFVVLLAVVAAAVWLFFDGFDAPGFVARLAGANPLYVAVAVVVYSASWYLRGARYADILGRTGHDCGVIAMTGAVFVSQTANLVFPARAGDGARAYIVKKRNGVPYTAGVASLTAERVLDLVAVLSIGGIGLVLTLVASGGFEPTRGRDAFLAAVAVGGVTVAVVFGVYLVRGTGSSLRGREGDGRLDEVFRGVGEFVADLGAVFDGRRGVARLSATSLGIWLIDVATCVVVFYALGVTFDGLVAVSLLAVSVGNLAKVVPATPGGVGLYEAGFAAVVVGATGLGWETAVAVAVLDHALKNGVTVVGGVASALVLNVSLTRPAEAEVEMDV
ncbi:MAG: lysylphosphatidylglycerol synthase transmembrane domain-containing protein [Halobacteriales archaeon]|nr:lysylphosphatidylglycerol synthase transmembrane domain-containing protein [Halobacteriales archaeon]